MSEAEAAEYETSRDEKTIQENPFKIPEILAKLLYYLELSELKNCRRVSHLWKEATGPYIENRIRKITFFANQDGQQESNIEEFTHELRNRDYSIFRDFGLELNEDLFNFRCFPVQNFFETFGHNLKTLEIFYDNWLDNLHAQEIFLMLPTHCPNLEEFYTRMCYDELEDEPILDANRPKLTKLKKFTWYDPSVAKSVDSCNEILTYMPNLVDLHYRPRPFSRAPRTVKFIDMFMVAYYSGNLHRLQNISCDYEWVDSCDFKWLFKLELKLKELALQIKLDDHGKWLFLFMVQQSSSLQVLNIRLAIAVPSNMAANSFDVAAGGSSDLDHDPDLDLAPRIPPHQTLFAFPKMDHVYKLTMCYSMLTNEFLDLFPSLTELNFERTHSLDFFGGAIKIFHVLEVPVEKTYPKIISLKLTELIPENEICILSSVFPNLKKLEIMATDGIMKEIYKLMPQLEELIIWGDNLTDLGIMYIKPFKKLKKKKSKSFQLENEAPFIGTLKNLRVLEIINGDHNRVDCRITGLSIAFGIVYLSKLESLSMINGIILSPDSLTALAHIFTLRRLYIQMCTEDIMEPIQILTMANPLLEIFYKEESTLNQLKMGKPWYIRPIKKLIQKGKKVRSHAEAL